MSKGQYNIQGVGEIDLTIPGANPPASSVAAGVLSLDLTVQQAKASCSVATAAALPTYTYLNGVITASANGALTVDGVSVVANNRVLLVNGAAGSDNGIYTVTQAGDASHPFILTRDTDCNSSANYIAGSYTAIEQGTINSGSVFVLQTQGSIVVGTTSVTWKTAVSGGGSGTVTSVALTVPAEFSVSGSPITGAGTLAITKANESANLAYAGPSSGSAAAPTFRALVPADCPALVASGASHQAGIAPDPGSTAGTTRFLREDATWQVPSGGGGGNQVGVNIATFPYNGQGTNTGSWVNFSWWLKIPAGAITNKAASIKLVLQFTSGTTILIGNCNILLCNPYSPTVLSNTVVKFGGSLSPTLTVPGGTTQANPYLAVSDAVTLTVDGTKDIYVITYFPSGAGNASMGVAETTTSVIGQPIFGDVISGNQTSITNVTTSLGAEPMNGGGRMIGLQQIIIAS